MGDGRSPREKSPTVEAPTVGERSRAWLFLGKGLRLWLPTVAPRASPPMVRRAISAVWGRRSCRPHAPPESRRLAGRRKFGRSCSAPTGASPSPGLPGLTVGFPNSAGELSPDAWAPPASPSMVRAISAVWGRRSCRPHAPPESQRLAGRRFDQKTLPHQRTRPCTRKDSRSGPSTGISG